MMVRLELNKLIKLLKNDMMLLSIIMLYNSSINQVQAGQLLRRAKLRNTRKIAAVFSASLIVLDCSLDARIARTSVLKRTIEGKPLSAILWK